MPAVLYFSMRIRTAKGGSPAEGHTLPFHSHPMLAFLFEGSAEAKVKDVNSPTVHLVNCKIPRLDVTMDKENAVQMSHGLKIQLQYSDEC